MLQGPIRCTGRYFQSDPDESVDCICATPPDPLVATPRSLGFFMHVIAPWTDRPFWEPSPCPSVQPSAGTPRPETLAYRNVRALPVASP
jgi:hypothetical protein